MVWQTVEATAPLSPLTANAFCRRRNIQRMADSFQSANNKTVRANKG